MHHCYRGSRKTTGENFNIPVPALCSITWLARASGLSRLTVERLLESGRIASVPVGSRVLVPRAEAGKVIRGEFGGPTPEEPVNSKGRAA